MRRFWIATTSMVGIAAMLIASSLPVFALSVSTPGDITTFLGSNARTGYNPNETSINPGTASNLKVHWVDTAGGSMTDQVMVANGMLYWGSWDGVLHASDPGTGQEIWSTSLGTKPGSCGQTFGIVGSPTIATIPVNGTSLSVVYVAGGQDNLYALDASTGNILWQTNLGNDPAEFVYDSTTVYNNSVYIGISSFGDCPFVQGRVVQLDASTGQLQNTFDVVPSGCLGGGVWGSLAIDETTGMLYFGTGNADSCNVPESYATAIVELNAANLAYVSSWPVPATDATPDNDYGSTPTLFPATINGVSYAMLGMVNKNGYYYALDRTNISAGALWKVRISPGGTLSTTSISSSTYDGTNLYVGSGATTVQGQWCKGSLLSLNPSTGAINWQICLDSLVAEPIISVPGLAVVGYGNTMSVVNSATGQLLFSYQDPDPDSKFEGAATISNGMLYDGSTSGNLFAFGL